MSRRLNPELFNNNPSVSDTVESSSSMVATRRLEQELKQAKKRISHLESLIEVMQSQMRITTDNTDKRTQVFSKAISELEKDLRESELSQNKRMDNFEARVQDNQVVEQQVENLITRFNSSLMQFENKISVLQKVISEKDMTLMSYRRILEQLIDEVEKLKNPQVTRRSPYNL